MWQLHCGAVTVAPQCNSLLMHCEGWHSCRWRPWPKLWETRMGLLFIPLWRQVVIFLIWPSSKFKQLWPPMKGKLVFLCLPLLDVNYPYMLSFAIQKWCGKTFITVYQFKMVKVAMKWNFFWMHISLVTLAGPLKCCLFLTICCKLTFRYPYSQ